MRCHVFPQSLHLINDHAVTLFSLYCSIDYFYYVDTDPLIL